MAARSLLLGCGNTRDKRIGLHEALEWVGELTTIDMNPNCGADIVHDLEKHPLPFEDETFDELAAYDVLEHLGKQGDWRGYFDEFAEYWRILKPGGFFGIIVPVDEERFADMGHTRFFCINHFYFLCQDFYAEAIGKGNPVTDYRWYWKLNFNPVYVHNFTGKDGKCHHLGVVLQKAPTGLAKTGD